MTDVELLAAFEACTLPMDAWNHRAHVRVASIYASRHNLAEAVCRMRSSIQAYNASRNTPDALDRGYHETMTVAFMRLVFAANQLTGPHESSVEFCEAHPELLDRTVLRTFYSKERILTWQAKADFAEPDLAPLPVCESPETGQSPAAGESPESSESGHRLDAAPTADEVAFLDAELDRFNSTQTARDDFKPLNLVVRDDNGAVIAGLKSQTGWDWLYVQVLWVHEERRGSGLGSQLLQAAEAEAQQRGCIGSCLTSYTFQAPEFYARHGYSTFGQIDDYPVGQAMFFFSKRFYAES